MKFCRACYATMADDETVCHSCGTPWMERKEVSSIAPSKYEPSTRILAQKQKPSLQRPVKSKEIKFDIKDVLEKIRSILSVQLQGLYCTDLALIVLVSVFFMWSAIIAQNSTFGGDNISLSMFWNGMLRDSLLQFRQLPLWNPYYFGGLPFVGNPQTSPFYFSSILVLLLGEGDGTRWSVILHVILSGLTMYYLQMVLRQRRLGALLSAFGYMFSGYVIGRLAIGHIMFVYAYAWAPLAFAFCEKAVKTGRLKFAIITGAVLAFQLLAGGLIVMAFTSMLIGFYLASCLLLWYWRNRLQLSMTPVLKYGSIGIVIAIVFSTLAALKLFPMFEFVLQTSRIVERGSLSGGIPNVQGIYSSLFQENALYYNSLNGYGWWEYSAYIGFLILPAMAAIVLTWPRSNRTIFFLLVVAFSLILGMGAYSPFSGIVIFAYNNLPLLSALLHLPARFLFLTVFSIVVLSGTAVSSLLEKAEKFKSKIAIRSAYVISSVMLIVIILNMGFFASANFGTVTMASSPPYTSKAPHDLSVSWLQYPGSITARSGESVTISVTAKNVGDTVWLKGAQQTKGTVKLGILIGESSSSDFRYPLTNDVAPGDVTTLKVTFPNLANGKYRVAFNFVDELVAWFDPPYPSGNLTVSPTNTPSVSIVTTPVDSYSETHALVWISQKNSEYARIGPYTTFEGNLYDVEKLRLYSVGGYETEGIQLPHYDRFVSNSSFKSLGLLSMKYVLVNNQMFSNDLILVYKASPWFVYENIRSLSRAYSIDHGILIVGSDDEIFAFQNALINKNYFDPAKIAIFRGDSSRTNEYDSAYLKRFDRVILFPSLSASIRSSMVEKCRQSGVAEIDYAQVNDNVLRIAFAGINTQTYVPQQIKELSPNKILLGVKTTSPSFLIISEVDYQGWRAYVDDVEVPILSAYSVLRAIYINSPGMHEVSFAYQPASFALGVIVTIATPLIILVVIRLRPWLHLPVDKRKRQFDQSAVRQCRHCGRQLNASSQFCDSCGKPA